MSTSFKLTLDDLLYAFETSQGVGRLVVMSRLRHYVRTVDMLTVMDEIRRITDTKRLDILIGVGMPGALWAAVVSRKADLMGVS